MISNLLTKTYVFIISFIPTPLLYIDGIHELVFGSLIYGNNIIYGVIIPTLVTISLGFYPIWEVNFIDEWVYNGGAYELIILHIIFGISCYVGHEWELILHLGMYPWIVVSYSTLVAVSTVIFLIYRINQGSFYDGMPLGISSTFKFIIVLYTEL